MLVFNLRSMIKICQLKMLESSLLQNKVGLVGSSIIKTIELDESMLRSY